MEEPRLKACPFENVKKDYEHKLSIAKHTDSHDMWRVGCACGARGPIMGFDKQSAIDGWNRRTPASVGGGDEKRCGTCIHSRYVTGTSVILCVREGRPETEVNLYDKCNS